MEYLGNSPDRCSPLLCVGNLWYRQGLTPSYPQGSAWELISNNVTKVSVGPLDQVSTMLFFLPILVASNLTYFILQYLVLWCCPGMGDSRLGPRLPQ